MPVASPPKPARPERGPDAKTDAEPEAEPVAETRQDEPSAMPNQAATDPLDWSRQAFKLELDGLARQVVLNAVVADYADDRLKLALLPELELMLKPDIQSQIKQAIERQLGVSLKLEFECVPALDVETPHQAEIRRQEQQRQEIIGQIHQDPVVRQLKSVFGAELVEQSVRKREQENERG